MSTTTVEADPGSMTQDLDALILSTKKLNIEKKQDDNDKKPPRHSLPEIDQEPQPPTGSFYPAGDFLIDYAPGGHYEPRTKCELGTLIKAVAILPEYGIFFQSGYKNRPEDHTIIPPAAERADRLAQMSKEWPNSGLDWRWCSRAIFWCWPGVQTIRRDIPCSLDTIHPSGSSEERTMASTILLCSIQERITAALDERHKALGGPAPEPPYRRSACYASCAELTALVLALFRALALPAPTESFASHVELQAIVYFILQQRSLASLFRPLPATSKSSAAPKACVIQISKTTGICGTCKHNIAQLMLVLGFPLHIYGPRRHLLLSYGVNGELKYPLPIAPKQATIGKL